MADFTEAIKAALLVLLIISATAAATAKKTLPAIIIFSSFSLIMAVVWALLESPDLAITEAAVGAGVSGVLFFMAYRRMGMMSGGKGDDGNGKEDDDEHKG